MKMLSPWYPADECCDLHGAHCQARILTYQFPGMNFSISHEVLCREREINRTGNCMRKYPSSWAFPAKTEGVMNTILESASCNFDMIGEHWWKASNADTCCWGNHNFPVSRSFFQLIWIRDNLINSLYPRLAVLDNLGLSSSQALDCKIMFFFFFRSQVLPVIVSAYSTLSSRLARKTIRGSATLRRFGKLTRASIGICRQSFRAKCEYFRANRELKGKHEAFHILWRALGYQYQVSGRWARSGGQKKWKSCP